MNYKLQKIFDLLESDTQSTLAGLSSLTEEQLNYSPSPATWSINQILIHLLTSERMSLSYMKKKSLGIESLRNSGWRESIKLFLLIVSQRIPLKYKAPGVLAQNTPGVIPFPTLLNEWKITRNEIRNFLTEIEERNINKKVFKNPVIGMLDVVQGLKFFREHLLHHRPQLKRLTEKLNKRY